MRGTLHNRRGEICRKLGCFKDEVGEIGIVGRRLEESLVMIERYGMYELPDGRF